MNPFPACIVAALATTLAAQTLVIPAAANAGDLGSASGWPFDYAGNMRILYVYDSTHFTGQNVTSPVMITRIRVRANGATATWVGDTINNLSVDLSTSPLDFNSISTTYDSNHGPDRTQVFTGSVTIPGGSATTGLAGPYVVDVVLSTPFLYDPNAGDLTVDWTCSGPSNAANTPTLDNSNTTGQALAKRVYGLSYTGAATGSLWSGESAHALEFTFNTGGGFASASTYGQGCYDAASSVYETFTGNFDLAGAPTTSIRFFPNGAGGFTAVPGTGAFFTPTSPDLLLTDESLTPALTLPFTFPFGTHLATAVKMSSNGFLWLRSTETAADLTPTPAELLLEGPRIAPLWMDLNPASLLNGVRVGSVHQDVDPTTNNAVFTWLNVPEYGAANVGNQNTFQIELEPTGSFEIRWQNIATTATRAILTGVSFGLGARDGGSYDLSAALPIVTVGDTHALRLTASARPVLGTTFQLVTSEIPGNVVLGTVLLGFQQFQPGIDLGALGAAGCRQYASIDASALFVGSGPTNALSMSFPANPAYAGLRILAQSAVLSPGINALGLATSNGVALGLDVN